MARPRKIGLEYFPLDCVLDVKVDDLRSEHGNDGFAVWIALLQEAYQTERGELDCSEVIRRKTLAKRANVTCSSWEAIVATAVHVGLFDADAWSRGVITSHGIKKRIAKIEHEREIARNRRGGSYAGVKPPNNGGKESIESSSSSSSDADAPTPEPPKRKPPAPKATDDDRALASLLATRIRDNGNATANAPNLASWSEHIEKLRRIDGIAPDEIRRVLEWSQRDPFWRGNILSAKTLREKFAALRAKMMTQPAAPPQFPARPLAFAAAQDHANRNNVGRTWQSVYQRLRGPDGKAWFVPPADQGRPIPDGFTPWPTETQSAAISHTAASTTVTR